MSAPSVVVFDFGGVLIEWDPRHLYRKLFVDDEAGMEHFLTHVCSATWNWMQDAGRSFDEAVAELTGRFPEHADLIAAYHERWEEMQPFAFDDTVAILRELKAKGVPVYGITNFPAEKFEITRRRHSFFDLLDGIVVSGDVCLMKPDPGIFLHFLDRFGLEASQCAFIDDSMVNTDVATRLGFFGVHHRSADELRKKLTEWRLL
ncbi:MAG: HAD family phosphatase [Rhodospirillales bacterium]|nr:HAD family phosphatase [Alphaproteobacteria bacterium]MBL6929617.1 HAD family phosphatase [Rhodospirillales bacterium]